MHPRASTVTRATDIDAGVAHIRDEVEPQLLQQKGFRGISVSADRSDGLVIVLSLWETEADLEASESAAAKVRADALSVVGGEVSVDRYEQLLWETLGEGPRPGAKLFIRGNSDGTHPCRRPLCFLSGHSAARDQGDPGCCRG